MAKRLAALMERQVSLEYLWQCALGESTSIRKRNVRLRPRSHRFTNSDLEGHFSCFPYRNSHRLENRDPNSISGTWGISHWRSEKTYGNVPARLFDDETRFEDITQEIWTSAKAFRKLCYYRITSSQEAVQCLENRGEVRFACEITSDWYDPPAGVIPDLPADPAFIAAHAVPISYYDPGSRRFSFPNSWGEEWGDEGWGEFPMSYWDRAIVNAWDTVCAGMEVPQFDANGLIVRGWKWSYVNSQGVHAIEIYDAAKDENIAWAFCVRRGNGLDVDEFFVRPEERLKGYARHLRHYVLRLADAMRLPIRLVVDFADTEDYSINGATAVARLFDVDLVDADVRWASMFGVRNPPTVCPRKWRPHRPESILEKLRPLSETKLSEPRQYTVFYGTDRRPLDPANLSRGFSNQRGMQLFQGSCLVEIPSTHRFGGTGRSWWERLTLASGNELRVVLNQPLSLEELSHFAKLFIKRAVEPDRVFNLLYMHGYNNSFEEAAKRAAQLGADLKVTGCTFFYSWPSSEQMTGYLSDEATVEVSVEFCVKFMMHLLDSLGDEPLHIVAHSMGNRLLVNVLERLAFIRHDISQIGQVVLAAADIDVDRFKTAVALIRSIPKRITAYQSRGDAPLHMSEALHLHPRLGIAPPITVVDGVDTILAEDFPTEEFVGHSYFGDCGAVLSDLFSLLRFGSSPSDRPRLIQKFAPFTGAPYWLLPVAK